MAPSLKDVARETGFAISTVSKVLNRDPDCYASQKTRETIQQTAQRLGYSPDYFARGLRQRRSFLIGVIGSFFGSEVVGAQVSALSRDLEGLGYLPLLGDTRSERKREAHLVSELQRKQVDGLVYFTFAPEEALAIVPPDLPCVIVGPHASSVFPSVVIDRAAAARRAVACLRELGHRRIAFVVNHVASNTEKVAGYRDAMTAAGLFDESLLIETGGIGGITCEKLLRDPDLLSDATAVFASSDITAAEVISALSRRGRSVPADCSVIGFDDSMIATALRPALTTLRQPRDEVGLHAARLLMDRIAGKPSETVTLVPELVVRESAAPLRNR